MQLLTLTFLMPNRLFHKENLPLWVVHFNGELLITEVEVFQLLPCKVLFRQKENIESFIVINTSVTFTNMQHNVHRVLTRVWKPSW